MDVGCFVNFFAYFGRITTGVKGVRRLCDPTARPSDSLNMNKRLYNKKHFRLKNRKCFLL